MPLYTKKECAAELERSLNVLRQTVCSAEVSHAMNIVVSELEHRKSGAAIAGRVFGWWSGNVVGLTLAFGVARLLGLV